MKKKYITKIDDIYEAILNSHLYKTLYIITAIIVPLISIYLSYKSITIAIPFYNEYIEQEKIPNLNGKRTMTFDTQETNFKKYKDMKLEYSMFMIGDKNKYKAKGEKIKIWGENLIGNQRDRLEMELIIKGDKIYGLYFLHGKERDSDGTVMFTIDKEGKVIDGIFEGNAADSRGKVVGLKLEDTI